MRKRLKRILIGIAIFLVILLGVAALPFCAPLRYSYTVAEAEADSALIGELIDLISDASTDEDDNIPEIIQVSIPPETVNALLRAAASRISREMKDEGVMCVLEWDKDAAAIRAAAAYALPLSLSVTARVSFVSPSIENGSIRAPASGLRAGLLPLPASLINDRLSPDKIRDENLKEALAAIHHLSAAPDGSLNVGVYPEKLSNLTRVLATERKGK